MTYALSDLQPDLSCSDGCRDDRLAMDARRMPCLGDHPFGVIAMLTGLAILAVLVFIAVSAVRASQG